MKTKLIFLASAILLIVSTIQTSAQNYTGVKTPQRIILNLTATPTTSMAVTWRTINEVNLPEVYVAEASSWTDFEKKAIKTKVESKILITDKKFKVFEHSAIMNNLKPNTLYAYKVGGDSIWSEWNQFKTASTGNEPFKFVFLGDPQTDLKAHCSRIFRQAYKTAPEAAFWLFSGDIITEPEDILSEGFFTAGGFIFSMIPSILTPGNHDFAYLMKDGNIVKDIKGKKQRSETVSNLFIDQFTLPENGLPGFEETSYCIDYQGVRFIMVNTNDEKTLGLQALWLDSVLKANPNKWTVVSFHHPFYSAGRDRDDDETRNAFVQVFDKYNVDLVLTGHDHAYSRSFKLKNGIKVPDKKNGTVYVVSVSGPKMYSVNSKYNSLMAKTGGNVQLFQVITVDGRELSFDAFTANGILYDTFKLKK